MSSALGEGLRAANAQAPSVAAVGRRRGRSALRGGEHGAIAHEVSILIGLGDGERAGRTPSKVSMTIIRPPQQGHR